MQPSVDKAPRLVFILILYLSNSTKQQILGRQCYLAQCHFLFVRTQCNDCHEFMFSGSAASKSLELKVNPWPIDSIAVSLLKIITLTAHAVIRSVAFHQKWGSCSFSAKSFSKTILSSTKQLLLIKIAALKDKCKVTIKMISKLRQFFKQSIKFLLEWAAGTFLF